MPYTALSHTADTGIEATASSFTGLIGELARGMFEIMGSVSQCAGPTIETTVEAGSREDLVVDVLSELLYRSEIEDLHFCDFGVEQAGDGPVRIRVRGVDPTTVTISGPPIKAVTYHDLMVLEVDGDWRGRVFFDV